MEQINEQELRKAFADIRRAYRLLAQLQSRLQDIVFYIRSKTKFAGSECAGNKLFSNEIKNRRSSIDGYASLKVTKSMWPWDFLYGYGFEYYFANTKTGYKTYAMSIIIICDDGYYISAGKKSPTSIKTFAPEDNSESWIILAYGDRASSDTWMHGKKDAYNFVNGFMSKKELIDKCSDDAGHVFIAKKYPMQNFYNQVSTDNILKDFAQIVEKESGVNILNKDEE